MTLCALLLTGVAAFSAGCGEDRSNLLPGNTVAEINANLDQVNELYASGDCIGAISTADTGPDQIRAPIRQAIISGTSTAATISQMCRVPRDAPGVGLPTVTMTVTCIDDPPAAVNDAATVNEDSGANAVAHDIADPDKQGRAQGQQGCGDTGVGHGVPRNHLGDHRRNCSAVTTPSS